MPQLRLEYEAPGQAVVGFGPAVDKPRRGSAAGIIAGEPFEGERIGEGADAARGIELAALWNADDDGGRPR
jgi:hypothetical protein